MDVEEQKEQDIMRKHGQYESSLQSSPQSFSQKLFQATSQNGKEVEEDHDIPQLKEKHKNINLQAKLIHLDKALSRVIHKHNYDQLIKIFGAIVTNLS